jgi:hypothetical protein
VIKPISAAAITVLGVADADDNRKRCDLDAFVAFAKEHEDHD